MVLSDIPQAAIRPELTRWDLSDDWVAKLAQNRKGQSLIIDNTTAAQGGMLCSLFVTPQTVDMLTPSQISELL